MSLFRVVAALRFAPAPAPAHHILRLRAVAPRPSAAAVFKTHATPHHRLSSTTTAATTSPPSNPIPAADSIPRYTLTFTCRPCQTRSTHVVTKQAYHKGSVLIQCPGCKNRHVIADHLKVFGETARSFEDILEQCGHEGEREKLRVGELKYGPQGEVEMLAKEGGEGES